MRTESQTPEPSDVETKEPGPASSTANLSAWESLNKLLPKVQSRLERILCYYQIPPQDAEDLIQDSVVTLLYKWEKIHSAEAWLLATLKRRCLMYWRSRRSRLTDAVDTAILELLAQPASPSQEKAELSHDLVRALECLPVRCQNLLRLRYGFGYKPAEVADRMGYRTSSIRKVASRCLAALNRQLTASGFFAGGGDAPAPARSRS
jgi:RNA polymerase sigma factor (sigma-70 family)